MSIARLLLDGARTLSWVILAVFVFAPGKAGAETEQTFDVLQIGTKTYRHVTVTTKAKNYIFILYEGGMSSIKISQLSTELKEKLGYVDPEKAKAAASTNSATAWATAEVTKLQSGKIKDLRAELLDKIRANKAKGLPAWQPVVALFPKKYIFAAIGILLVTYLIHCFCLMLICRKAGREPGPLVWVPIMQIIPMLRAARMSDWWLVPWLVPTINIIPFVVWCLKIAEARGKSIIVGILLLLPITGPFAFLYLAFSSAARRVEEPEEREPEIMSLQTA